MKVRIKNRKELKMEREKSEILSEQTMLPRKIDWASQVLAEGPFVHRRDMRGQENPPFK